MFRTSRILKTLTLALVMAGTALLSASDALADKLYLKDGTVLEGKVVREGPGWVFFKIKVGTVESETLYQMDKVLKIERDDPKPKTDEAIKSDETAKASAKVDTKKYSGATRVAILNFGGPSEWQGKHDDMVGLQVNADSFERAIPLLEKDKVDVVVVRVKSGGGALSELAKFHTVFEKKYKPRFRTVAWIESAISAAAMSPWVLEEMYFYPQGNIGACTGWFGNLTAVKGVELEQVLHMMEEVSALGKKDPAIMRAMQIMEPLSVDVDDNGEVHWRQDELGQYILNKSKNVLTLNAQDAVRFKFGKGIASTKEELAKVMGLQEVEWVGQKAAELIDKSIRDNDTASKEFQFMYQKYQLAISLADQLEKERRGIELSKARRLLTQMKSMVNVSPNLPMFIGIPPGWFEEQEELIKRIGQKP